MKEEIKYLQNQQIDKIKWDQCIDVSPNGLIYASSIYLDHIVETWDAIVINDYEALMPIPWKKKYGIKYVYQPPFIQQLGLIYKDERFSKMLHLALKRVTNDIKFGDYPLNFLNSCSTTRQNYILLLLNDYVQISDSYSNDLKRNLKKAEKHQLSFAATNDYEVAIKLYQLQYASRVAHVTQLHFQKLKKLIQKLTNQDKIIIREAKDRNGDLLAINLCLRDSKRIYLLLSSTTNEGRNKEANHFLLDQMIREFARQDLIFDFEGSDIPGIAYFYQGFGATKQPYYFYQWNNLPFPIKFIKSLVEKITK
jgi:hypothetical protein